ncbi:hypothetical protein [Vibrio lentus]|uniref:hypothetical protein n=1 Tax=Vibrio lentus TaxID=136468 RepID=UPI000C836F9F|nr:hypothetical protein [Vibrio lentus]PMI90633.1 hypothetical protein BCU35_04000 [Vibrio lentus]PMI97835.1 hypothetical protein BCU32_18615 [Vibrio lentus]
MIKQPSSESGCGIACVANLIGKSYEDTYELMAKTDCKNRNDDRVTINQIKNFLSLFEITNRSKTTLNSKKSAIVYVRWPFDRRYKHWVIFHDKRFWDPAPYTSEPSFDYPTKPEYIIEINSDFVMKNLQKMAGQT